jgi:hypothetical protein
LGNTLQADGRGDKDEYPGEGIFTILAIMAFLAIMAVHSFVAIMAIMVRSRLDGNGS